MRLLLILLPLAVLLAACGGDEEDAAATATPDAAGGAPAGSGVDSIRIPSLNVDAPLTPKQLVPGEPPPSPDGPYDVAIYEAGAELADLGGSPGEGGNVVLAGESVALQGCVGAEPPCNAVFVSLRRIDPGAAVDLFWQGKTFNYQVVARCFVATADFDEALYRRTAEEQLTLITGTGSWDNVRGWSHVLIIIAKPAPRTALESCP
jgi:hypothetical protein